MNGPWLARQVREPGCRWRSKQVTWEGWWLEAHASHALLVAPDVGSPPDLKHRQVLLLLSLCCLLLLTCCHLLLCLLLLCDAGTYSIGPGSNQKQTVSSVRQRRRGGVGGVGRRGGGSAYLLWFAAVKEVPHVVKYSSIQLPVVQHQSEISNEEQD